jgi:ABC-2 type transport system ATP-binding protein
MEAVTLAPQQLPVVHHGDLAAPAATVVQGTAPAIRLAGLTMQWPGTGRPSVDRLDLTIEPGQVFGLLGPNGSGKTTTINLITGLWGPSSGTVQVFGRQPEHARRLMGVVTQETALYARLDAWHNLAFQAALYGYTGPEKRARIEDALDLANLRHEVRREPACWYRPWPRWTGRRVGKFSGGMARRLAIARALLHDPPLIILDEPTLGVDPNERSVLWEHIGQLRDTGITVLLTTNVMEEASALCDQVAIMRDGVLAAPVDTPANLQQRYGGAVITVQVAAGSDEVMRSAYDSLLENPGIQHAEITRGEQPGEYRLQITAAAEDPVTGQVITLLTGKGAVIRHVTSRTPSLDEVFRQLTGGFRVMR